MVDWNLLWYALSNALTNADKHGGDAQRGTSVTLGEEVGTLHVTVSNTVNIEQQARRIASHGVDATHLLRRRGDGASAMSSNVGGKVLLDVTTPI